MKTAEPESLNSRSTEDRIPLEQARRNAILLAASEHVRHYGYRKTTVGDIAKAIHLSTAYLYHFFESKQAIGEAVCMQALEEVTSALALRTTEIVRPGDSILFIFSYLAGRSRNMFLEDRKIHDLITLSFQENWGSQKVYNAALLEIVRRVVLRGRQTGEFERKTPLDETCEAIRCTTEPFFHPILLEQNSRKVADEAVIVASLVHRSLIC
jgi:AcrR family transcriptional regulator